MARLGLSGLTGLPGMPGMPGMQGLFFGLSDNLVEFLTKNPRVYKLAEDMNRLNIDRLSQWYSDEVSQTVKTSGAEELRGTLNEFGQMWLGELRKVGCELTGSVGTVGDTLKVDIKDLGIQLTNNALNLNATVSSSIDNALAAFKSHNTDEFEQRLLTMIKDNSSANTTDLIREVLTASQESKDERNASIEAILQTLVDKQQQQHQQPMELDNVTKIKLEKILEAAQKTNDEERATLTKVIDIMREESTRLGCGKDTFNTHVNRLMSEHTKVHASTVTFESLCTKLTTLNASMEQRVKAQQTASTNIGKGQEGEERMFDAVSDALMTRSRDYIVTRINGEAHNCDIKVKRLGKVEVRLEVKNHVGKVSSAEVTRFRSDLLLRNSDGIMLSIQSGICGQGYIGIESLTNGKYAMYMSNTGYDGKAIADVISHLHALHREGSDDNPDGSSQRITGEELKEITRIMIDGRQTLSSMNTHIKELTLSTDKLRLTTFTMIERILKMTAPAKVTAKANAVASIKKVPAPPPIPTVVTKPLPPPTVVTKPTPTPSIKVPVTLPKPLPIVTNKVPIPVAKPAVVVNSKMPLIEAKSIPVVCATSVPYVNFPCSACDKVFKTTAFLKKHMELTHNEGSSSSSDSSSDDDDTDSEEESESDG